MKRCPFCRHTKPLKEFKAVSRYGRKYIAVHCKKCRDYIYSWQRANKKKLSDYRKKWDKKNRARVNEYWMKWYRTSKIRKNWRKRKTTHRRGAPGRYTYQEWKTLCKKYDYRCAKCKRRRKLTADHKIPVSKGGTNFIENIQPLCQPCNSSKGNRYCD